MVLFIMFIALTILGALGYLEQLFGLKWGKKTLGLLLACYLLFSTGQQFMQWYEDNNEREQARQSEVQLKTDLTSTQQQLTEQRAKGAELQHTVDVLRDYSSVARLDPHGVTGAAGAGLKETSPISKALDMCWLERGGKIHPLCNDPCLEKFRHVAHFLPRFPWSYYALAVCLRPRGDGTWRSYAQQAVDIFEATTLLADHNTIHDQGLQELRGYLRASE
jgi:hypothetical protein